MPVLLLRSPSDEHDIYQDAFQGHPAGPATSVAVLTTILKVDDLARTLSGDPDGIDAIVINSQRSVDALSTALKTVDQSRLSAWSGVTWYVVGSATATALRGLPFPFETGVRGEESGSSTELGKIILADDPVPRCVVILVGDKSRDELPQALQNAGVIVKKVPAYATGLSPSFPQDLRDAVKDLQNGKRMGPWWIGCFAPSSSSMALPHLLEHFDLPFAAIRPSLDGKLRARVAAIGKTTSDHLRQELKLHVDAVARKPDAAHLASAIGAELSLP